MKFQRPTQSTDGTNAGNRRIALVLQGGGALGAYQAGVYQAMQEHGLAPDWIVGNSIGAINAALIAGNKAAERVSRLREFWETVAHADFYDMRKMPDSARHFNTWLCVADAMIRGVPGFFSPRIPNPFAFGWPVPPEAASFYDTAALGETLRKLIDFQYLNIDGGIRLTVNAMAVTSGELVSFDNRKDEIGPEHIMASGALPPGFPPVRIDGVLYWDGGLYSNTPLEMVLDDPHRYDTLCFMVDLWCGQGLEPTTLGEVRTRKKDVAFASRSQHHIEDYVYLVRLQKRLRMLYEKLPNSLRRAADRKDVAELGSDTTMHIIRLPYTGLDWHMTAKDVNFSRGSIEWRWEQGYLDCLRAIKHKDWLSFQPDKVGVVVHDVTREEDVMGELASVKNPENE
jgi:NTE family protein